MDLLIFIFGIIFFLIYLVIYVSIPFWIKGQFIKSRERQQMQGIQCRNPEALQLMKRPQIELYYSIFVGLACGAIISVMFGFVCLYFVFTGRENMDSLRELIGISTLFTVAFYVTDLGIFYIRNVTGNIPGAVVFDKGEKKFFVFPALDSDSSKQDCNVYHESELIYTREQYRGYKFYDYAYVFFTEKDTGFAFKLDHSKKNYLDTILTSEPSTDLSVPFRYRYHTSILSLVSIAFGITIFAWIIQNL